MEYHCFVKPRKKTLARTIAKILHIRAGKTKRDDRAKNTDQEDDKLIKEAFLAKLFATISTLKASYAQLQFSQSPYDPDGIQTADRKLVSEFKNLSELKQCYAKKELVDTTSSPETALLLSEIQEQKSLLRTYEITTKKYDYEVKLKDSEITFLKEKLEEVSNDIKLLERRLSNAAAAVVPDVDIRLSGLKPSHFISYLRLTVKSVRSFVRVLISEMGLANWDVEAAADSIQPGVSFSKPSHMCFAIESYVCREMFEGFDVKTEFSGEKGSMFDRFMEMKNVRAIDYLAGNPKSTTFGEFCRVKYLRLVHPKMELSLFGNLNQRKLVSSGEIPETSFLVLFAEMAKRVWLLRCLGLSFDSEVDIFQVSKGSCFSEVYMESLNEEEAFITDNHPRVAFMVVPGFKIGNIIVQSQVYL